MIRMLVLFCMCISASSLYADGHIMAVTEEWEPYNYTGANGAPSGMAVDIVRELMRRTGTSAEIEIMPWARAYSYAQSGERVLIFTITRTPEREPLFKWIGPVAERSLYFYSLKKRTDIRIRKPADAEKLVTGAVNMDASHVELLKLGFVPGKNIDIVSSNENSIRMLFAGRFDLITGSDLTIVHLCRKMKLNPQDLVRQCPLVHSGEYFIAFSLKTPDELVQRFRKAFMQMQGDGTFGKIRSAYLR